MVRDEEGECPLCLDGILRWPLQDLDPKPCAAGAETSAADHVVGSSDAVE